MLLHGIEQDVGGQVHIHKAGWIRKQGAQGWVQIGLGLIAAYPAQEAELKKNKIKYEGRIYPDSVHGFFNDSTPERYNKVTAQEAWTRTIAWFNQHSRDAA